MKTPLRSTTWLMLASSVAASLPYNPTFTFYTEHEKNNILYIIDPPSETYTGGRLRGIGVSSRIAAASSPGTVLSNPLPFVTSASASYTAAIRSDGSILVFAGSCNGTSQSSQLWLYKLDTSSPNGAGRWVQQSLSGNQDDLDRGASALSSSFLFAANATSADAALYTFGGMCPFQNTTTDTWVQAAEYSNQMLTLEPDLSADNYAGQVLSNTGGFPVPESGFTITPLTPSYTNVSGVITVQQNFLWLGGQTSAGFLNMSQVALYSLPQSAWTYLGVGQATSSKTDLMAREDAQVIEPRSGHTAVLSTDGSKIIVFGGWVGDTSNAATPQLVVLNVGLGYSETESWTWSIPQSENMPIPNTSGVYGHGAVILPGNVMMISGGYEIPADGSITPTGQTMIDGVYFMNLTSGSWISSYDLSSAETSMNGQASSGGAPSKSSQKTGLGVGLPIGLLVVGLISLAVFILWRRHKEKGLAEERESELREKSLHEGEIEDLSRVASGNQTFRSLPRHGGNQQIAWKPQMAQRDQAGTASVTNPNNVWHGVRNAVAERTGYDLNLPSPNRGLRKGRLAYTPVARFEDQSLSRSAPTMLPIEERDEENASLEERLQHTERVNSEIVEANADDSENPFRDPPPVPLRISTTTAATAFNGLKTPKEAFSLSQPRSPAQDRHREMQDWIRDWSVAEAAMARAGRVSPSKSERTHSTLSQLSMASSSDPATHAGPTRQGRAQSRPTNPFVSPDASPTRSSASGESYRTPPSSRGRDVVAESENLLGRAQPPLPGARGATVAPDSAPTFIIHRPVRTHSRLGDWVGSVRRAVLPASTATQQNARSPSFTVSSGRPPLGGLVDASELEISPESVPASPIRPTRTERTERPSSPPKRSVSDGGSFWASKAGARDWGVATPRATSPREAHEGRDTGEGSSAWPGSDADNRREVEGDETDWDVERAAQNRLVQVMFTVPREKLRVVNAEVSSVSDSESQRRRSSSQSVVELNRASRDDDIDRRKARDI